MSTDGTAMRRVVAALKRAGCIEARPGLWTCPTCNGWLAVTQGEGRVHMHCLGEGEIDGGPSSGEGVGR